jgi:putative acetyltransferase
MSEDRLPIRTRSLLLRRFVPGDAEAVFLLSTEEKYRAWLPSQVYRDSAHAASVLEFLIACYGDPGNPARGPYVLAVEDRASGALIGHVGFSPLDDDVEIGFAIAEDHQGRGLAAEAVVAAAGWAMETFGLERIVGVTAAENEASKRTMARVGFMHEHDRVMNFQGTDQPVAVYALDRAPLPIEAVPRSGIRRFRGSDLDRLLDLWERASRLAHPFLDDDFLRRERRTIADVFMPKSETWVYVREGAAVGFISLLGNEIGGLFVDPSAQRQGIGRALVDHARSLRGELEVEVFAANRIGRGFYEGYGFTPAGEGKEAETGHPILRMRWGAPAPGTEEENHDPR